MHIVITDSGVGGLSVVAYAERFIRTHGYTEPVRLTFANAAPANDYGYNSMPSREVKIETFARFLRNVAERFAPDKIYIACNTLSVLLPDTPQPPVPIKGIVETGVNLLVDALNANPEAVAIIFATQTTIDSGTYARSLEARGIDAARIVNQACPGLADTISEDREGSKAAEEIRKWVATALSKAVPRFLGSSGSSARGVRGTEEPRNPRNRRVIACLACTHYGYRKDVFQAALGDATVINPNESAVDDLFDHGGDDHRNVEVEFVTRYALPETTVETLAWLLQEISPRTVAAMRNFVHIPDLF